MAAQLGLWLIWTHDDDGGVYGVIYKDLIISYL